MAVIRLEALKRLEQAIVCAIPELTDRICIGQAPPSREQRWPHLAIIPVSWSYDPNQAREVHEPAPDRVVMDVGAHIATVQLRLGASTIYNRLELEQKIVDLFLSTPLHPGVLLTEVLTCRALGSFMAAWEFGSDEWRNEAAFDNAFFSIARIEGTIPALVTRLNAYTIHQLQLGLSEEFGAETFGPPDVEVVLVNEDGTTSPVP